MPATLTVRDETAAGQVTHELTLDLVAERLTVRELIRSRVFQEVKDYNARQPEIFRGLVQPTDAERALNGCKPKKGRMIDWQQQFDKAVQAFEANQVLILVNDEQVDSLDDEFELKHDTRVSFLRLTPLVGG
jgi:hypothetical protein